MSAHRAERVVGQRPRRRRPALGPPPGVLDEGLVEPARLAEPAAEEREQAFAHRVGREARAAGLRNAPHGLGDAPGVRELAAEGVERVAADQARQELRGEAEALAQLHAPPVVVGRLGRCVPARHDGAEAPQLAHHELRLPTLRPFGHVHQKVQRLRELPERLRVRAERLVALGRSDPGLDRLPVTARTLEVEGGLAGVGQPRSRAVLEQRVRDPAVQRAPGVARLRLVGDLPDQLVAEAGHAVAVGFDEPGVDERLEPELVLARGHARHPADESAVDLAADRRRHLREVEVDAGRREPREQRVEQRGRDAVVGELDRPWNRGAALEGIGGAHELLEEQRHPVTALDEVPPFRLRELGALGHHRGHLHELGVVQGVELHRAPDGRPARAGREVCAPPRA